MFSTPFSRARTSSRTQKSDIGTALRDAPQSTSASPRLSYRQADTLWKRYTPDWDFYQLRHSAISLRAAHGYTEVDLKRFSGHSSLRSLERYIADNREAARCKAREWERRRLRSNSSY